MGSVNFQHVESVFTYLEQQIKMALTINRSCKEDNQVTLTLEGRLDTSTASQLEQEIQALENASCLTMDFEKLDYLSSAGLRVILMAQKKMNRCGEMILIHVNETIMEVFEVTGFIDILTIE